MCRGRLTSRSRRQLLVGDFDYKVFVKAEAWTGGPQLESLAFRVSESGLSVAVSGPQEIGRGERYWYRAEAVSCEGDQQPDGLTVRGRPRGTAGRYTREREAS